MYLFLRTSLKYTYTYICIYAYIYFFPKICLSGMVFPGLIYYNCHNWMTTNGIWSFLNYIILYSTIQQWILHYLLKLNFVVKSEASLTYLPLKIMYFSVTSLKILLYRFNSKFPKFTYYYIYKLLDLLLYLLIHHI